MMKKKIVSLVLAFMLCLSCVSALAAEAWTVTCPWAPSGVAAMVNQKAASLSTTYSQDYVLVANAEKGDTATINSWLTKYTEADPQMCFIGEGMFGITAILHLRRQRPQGAGHHLHRRAEGVSGGGQPDHGRHQRRHRF